MTLQCNGVCVTLGESPVLRDVDLEVARGLNVLVGANGSGKTTLLRALAGLQRIRAGTILLEGEDISGLGSAARRRKGIVYRGQRPLITPGLVSTDYLGLAFPADSLPQIVERAISIGYPEQLARKFAEPTRVDRMPLRDRRMLELMTATSTDAGIVLLDEPLASVGRDAVALLGPMLDAIADRCALLVVEHRKEFLAWLRERPATGSFIERGRMRLSNLPIRELLDEPLLVSTYGGAS